MPRTPNAARWLSGCGKWRSFYGGGPYQVRLITLTDVGSSLVRGAGRELSRGMPPGHREAPGNLSVRRAPPGAASGITEDVVELLIHKLGHLLSSGHLGAEYHGELCRIGAKLLALARPGDLGGCRSGWLLVALVTENATTVGSAHFSMCLRPRRPNRFPNRGRGGKRWGQPLARAGAGGHGPSSPLGHRPSRRRSGRNVPERYAERGLPAHPPRACS